MAIKIVSVLGTSRKGSLTAKVLELVHAQARATPRVELVAVAAGDLRLPWPGQAGVYPDVARLQELVRGASGVLLASPEYQGTFTAELKLVIENLGYPSVLAHKPVALLGVAAGGIGAIKTLEDLRGMCSHVGAIALPLGLSVARVHKVFDASGDCVDPGLPGSIEQLVASLCAYADALHDLPMRVAQWLPAGAAERLGGHG